MYPWSIDAREAVKDISDIDENLIEETAEIKVFLQQERYYFVIAPKGFGKSLVLLTKRQKLKGVECVIPRNLLLDVPEVTIETLSKDKISFLYEEDTMQKLWSLSIIIAVIKSLGMSEELLKKDISESLRYLLNEETTTVSGNFGEILRSISRSQFFQELIGEYNRLISSVQTVNKSVAIFIDNVDECFESLVRGFGRDIWYVAQNSLIEAIYKLVRLNPKFKFYASIRKEAFLKLRKTTEMYQQYKGVSLDLKYHKEELKEIFIKNIKKQDVKKLAIKDVLDSNPVRAFLGVDSIHHGYVNDYEETFDYIHRHTLQRPRDFMEMGHALSECPLNERNVSTKPGLDKVKHIINDTATVIANTYISEVLPHLKFKDRADFEGIFEFIDSNVIPGEELKKICMKYNKDYNCMTQDCKSCKDKTHIFCELYKTGLLGYVEEEPNEKGHYRQRFLLVGEKTFDDVGLLPNSTHYLIHPVLDGLVRKRNNSYKDRIDVTNIVGYDRPWKKSEETPSKTSSGTEYSIKGPFRLDTETPRLISKNRKTIPLKPQAYLVLKAMITPVEKLPIGVLKDDMVAKIFLKAKGKSDEEIRTSDAKKVSEEFARSLRRYLKSKFQILDEDAVIQRVEGGFIPGTAWAEKPLIYHSEVSLFYTDKPLRQR